MGRHSGGRETGAGAKRIKESFEGYEQGGKKTKFGRRKNISFRDYRNNFWKY